MNIYEDYINYINEHDDLIGKLYATNSQILLCIDDAIKVCDNIYKQYENKKEIDNEIAEIFEIGFGYLVNTINDLKVYFKEHFNNDIILFNQYASIMLYSLLIEDYKSHLISNEEYNGQIKQEIEKMLTEIDHIISNKVEYDDSKLQLYSEILEKLGYSEGFKPTYIVFAMILEELEV